MKNLQAIKERFQYVMENGLTLSEQEEKLLASLYETIERQERENLFLYGKLNQIGAIVDNGRQISKQF